MESEIQKFYKGQVIFLTGGTGFIGKQLIEKLLRTCPDLEKIYILVRPKKNKSPEQRFKDIFDYPLFDLMKKSNPNYYTKVELIVGDCTEENLGIDEEHLNLLKEKVTICIHNAANVNFTEPLRSAFKTNTFSTISMVKLASEMENLKTLVYVSTAYSQCHRTKVDETVYPTPAKLSTIQYLLDNFDDKFINGITSNLLDQIPNTYCYTKALAEEVISEASSTIPCAIVRPAIVSSTVYEPISGWMDNLYGAAGILIGIGMGVIKSALINIKKPSNLVPSDFVVNTILAAAWENARTLRDQLEQPKIYNYTGSGATWEYLYNNTYKIIWSYVPVNLISFPNFDVTTNRTIHKIRVFIWHTMMAHIADFILNICGKKPIAVKKYRFINKLLDQHTYFMNTHFEFSRKNTLALYKKMNETDKKLFNFNIDDLNMEKYLDTAFRGGRIYILKDPLDTIVYARFKLIIYGIIHYTFLGVLTYILYKFLTNIF